MQISHLYIYGDNINDLCDFYSFVFDCEVVLTDKDPYLIFDSHKFVFKKVLGSRESILPSFKLQMSADEFTAFKQRLELFAYKKQVGTQERFLSNFVELKDPAGNIFLVQTNEAIKQIPSKL